MECQRNLCRKLSLPVSLSGMEISNNASPSSDNCLKELPIQPSYTATISTSDLVLLQLPSPHLTSLPQAISDFCCLTSNGIFAQCSPSVDYSALLKAFFSLDFSESRLFLSIFLTCSLPVSLCGASHSTQLRNICIPQGFY